MMYAKLLGLWFIKLLKNCNFFKSWVSDFEKSWLIQWMIPRCKKSANQTFGQKSEVALRPYITLQLTNKIQVLLMSILSLWNFPKKWSKIWRNVSFNISSLSDDEGSITFLSLISSKIQGLIKAPRPIIAPWTEYSSILLKYSSQWSTSPFPKNGTPTWAATFPQSLIKI